MNRLYRVAVEFLHKASIDCALLIHAASRCIALLKDLVVSSVPLVGLVVFSKRELFVRSQVFFLGLQASHLFNWHILNYYLGLVSHRLPGRFLRHFAILQEMPAKRSRLDFTVSLACLLLQSIAFGMKRGYATT